MGGDAYLALDAVNWPALYVAATASESFQEATVAMAPTPSTSAPATAAATLWRRARPLACSENVLLVT